MLTVERCLCFKLEIGGFIIGWFTLVGSILLALVASSGVVFLCINDCNDLENFAGNEFIIRKMEMCPTLRGVIIAACIFVIIGGLTFAFVGWKCIHGVKTRDPSRIIPLMILSGMATIFSIATMLTLTVSGVFNGIINATINGYSFIVLYSLYNVFNLECENRTENLQQEEK